MEDIYKKIEEQLKNDRPFAVYCKPGSNKVMALFQADNITSYLSDFSAKGFVFAPFTGNDIILLPAEKCEILFADLKSEPKTPITIQEATINPTAKNDFEALVTKCVDAIKTGQFTKLVASRTEKVSHNTNIRSIYNNLLHTYPNAFRYCFYSPESGLWMGATPEQLVRINGNMLNTVALAGTQVYHEGEEAVWEDKEKTEQQIVTDYIVDVLQENCSDITTTRPYTFRAGNIVHIKTDISAKLNLNQTGAVIKKLHPTPAVCGMPKQAAAEWLIANEGYNRDYYAGYLGELNMGTGSNTESGMDLFVNLRSMKVSQNDAQLFIGCGITAESNPEKEFIETVNKSMTMRKVLSN